MSKQEAGILCTAPGYGATKQQQELFISGEEQIPEGARNIRLLLTVQGDIDPELVRTGFDWLVGRHEILRTTDGSRCDFAAVGRNDLREISFNQHLIQESSRRFDLCNGPLLRVRLYGGAGHTSSLLLCAPFATVDLASLRILAGEFEIVYSAIRNGCAPSLPAPESVFDLFRKNEGTPCQPDARAAFGPEAGASPILDLPFDYRLKSSSEDAQGEVPFELPEALTAQLQSLTLASGCTPPSLFLAAYAILLSRYSATERVPVALLATGRGDETGNAVGNFSRLTALVVECMQQTPFNELHEQVWNTAVQALGRGPEPLLRSGEESADEGADAPVCSAYFAWENGGSDLRPRSEASLDLIEAGCLPLPGLFALGLRLGVRDGLMRGALLYRCDLFTEATAERMSRQYLQLLVSIGKGAAGPIGDLKMLPEEERRQVLACTGAEQIKSSPDCLHELFSRQAALRPDSEALMFGGERLTYGELDRRSNQVAGFLRAEGLRPQEIVGVCMAPSVDWVVALVGILKAGGAYAPIDPKYPAERILFMIEDMAARWVITHQAAAMPGVKTAALIYMDDPDSGIYAASCDPVPNVSAPDFPAVMIYTSGTTGNPKGALIPHRAVIRVACERNYVNVTPEDRVAQHMSPSFDVCLLEVWSALTNGAALIGVSREDLLTTERMARILETERISFMAVPAAYLNQIGREAPAMLRKLRTVFYGGEAADPKLIRNILKAGPPRNLVNAYGPTEGCIIASCHRIESIEPDAASIPIGRPLTNARMYLLDSNLRPVPFGVPGEICIGGDIALGYWRRPELTSEKFLPDLNRGGECATFYRTGDMARLRADGEFDFLGRKDQQVKVRGFRIELGAIQNELTSHPDVADAVVMVREDQPGDRRLVAYVTLHSEPSRAEEVLRRYLQSRIPDYMVPAVIIPVPSIPLNLNGKIDHAALPSPSERSRMVPDSEAPRTEVQKAVAAIWRELLAVEEVSLSDNFFDLGGDSLLGMRLAVSIRESLGVGVPLQKLFSAATLGDFCVALEAVETSHGRLEKIAGILNQVDSIPPTELEEAFRFLDRQ